MLFAHGPVAYAAVANPNYLPRPLGLGAEGPMAQEAADIVGDLVKLNIEIDQAVGGMSQPGVIEAVVLREEGRTAEAVEQWEYLVLILHA